MLDIKRFMKNQKAVSEVVGEVLLTTIAVLLVSSIGIFIATYDGATDIPHTQVREWMNAGKDTIYLEHSGGEFLGTDAFEIVVNINEQKYVYPSASIYSNLNNSSWQLGDRIEINTSSEWGVNITDGDEIKVFLIDIPSRQTIQYLTISSKQDVAPAGVYP
ncbi:hypothetical protein MSHOH_3892 [Methanosarcina horonobensis HB-1 = JCM 15518]|uniref:Archaeal Type IV pilin N-terminal domain-containing protein n=1 Tax=Methanosarcina horonobensis HB-1 = JCM 15518 TaxID=1434110 RepID=A0A0E3WWV7_9EURY|nr:type IV pilin N-terminal domain-containing protein [Methanosarcina horonobensis]AKB80375.1 hypothetical protein MSHOH_3892 [Methanosarcina horonobensis HB-1 = JCM 15518]